MQAQMRNPDRRPLPPGWVDHYDSQRRLWYYININSTTPKVNFIHPDDQDPPTPPANYGYPPMPQAPSPPISPPQQPYQRSSMPQSQHRMPTGGTPYQQVQAQAQAQAAQPSRAQQLYASSVSAQNAYPTPSSSNDQRSSSYGGSPTQSQGSYFDASSMYSSPVSTAPSPSNTASGLPSPPVSPQTLHQANSYQQGENPYPSRRQKVNRPASSNGGHGYSFASLPALNENNQNHDDFRSRALFQAAPHPNGPTHSRPSHQRSSTTPNNGLPSNSNPLPSGVFMKPKETPTYTTVAKPQGGLDTKLSTAAFQPHPPHHANTLPAPAADGHFQLPGIPQNHLGLATMPTPGVMPQYTGTSVSQGMSQQMTGQGGQLPTPMQTPSIPSLPPGAAAPQMVTPSLPQYQQGQAPTPAPTPFTSPLTPPPPPPQFTTTMQAPSPPPQQVFQQSAQMQPLQMQMQPGQQLQTQLGQAQQLQMQTAQGLPQMQQQLQVGQVAQATVVQDPVAAAQAAAAAAAAEEEKKKKNAALKKAGIAMGKTALKFGAKIALGSVGVPEVVSNLAVNAAVSGVSAVATAVSESKPNSPTVSPTTAGAFIQGTAGQVATMPQNLPNMNFALPNMGQPAAVPGTAQYNAMVNQMQALQIQQQQQQQLLLQQQQQQAAVAQQAMANQLNPQQQQQQQAFAQQLAMQQQQQQMMAQQIAQQQAAMQKQQQLLAQQANRPQQPQQSIIGNILGQATHAAVSTTLESALSGYDLGAMAEGAFSGMGETDFSGFEECMG